MLVSLLMPNGVFAYLGVVGFWWVVSIFLPDGFSPGGFRCDLSTVSPSPEANFIGLSLCFVIISLTLSFLIWQRRDFTA